MARQFKPVRFFAIIAAVAFIICGVTSFYTHRAAHGLTSEERSGYFVGEKAGEDSATSGGKLPNAADLNMIAQDYFRQQGSGEPMAWKLAFENGYQDGFNKKHVTP